MTTWQDFLSERLFKPLGYTPSDTGSFRVTDPLYFPLCMTTNYASPYHVCINGQYDEATLSVLRAMVELLEAAQRGEIEGWRE